MINSNLGPAINGHFLTPLIYQSFEYLVEPYLSKIKISGSVVSRDPSMGHFDTVPALDGWTDIMMTHRLHSLLC